MAKFYYLLWNLKNKNNVKAWPGKCNEWLNFHNFCLLLSEWLETRVLDIKYILILFLFFISDEHIWITYDQMFCYYLGLHEPILWASHLFLELTKGIVKNEFDTYSSNHVTALVLILFLLLRTFASFADFSLLFRRSLDGASLLFRFICALYLFGIHNVNNDLDRT